eukprot:3825342-Alexandrium_andersonii.AAC.1
MSASLVGSEMCIRDRAHHAPPRNPQPPNTAGGGTRSTFADGCSTRRNDCLLYTSDAADDM